MKKTVVLSLILLQALTAWAGDRIFVVTDRNTYVAGDQVFCSVFAVDENGRNSGFSAVSYLELISTDGTLTEAKIGLFNGRGAGSFRIPANAPTGNYRLVGYTARSGAVPGAARVLSVFNTTSTARVKDGTEIVPAGRWAPAAKGADVSEGLRLSVPARIRQGRDATLLLEGTGQEADLVVSVFHEDDLSGTPSFALSGALQGGEAIPGGRTGEYEGEIIYASVEGLDADVADSENVTAFLSTTGSSSNVFVGQPSGDGLLKFYTGNIYGDREIVCEVVSMYGKPCHISLRSPFTHPDPGAIPVLGISPAQREALVLRKAALRAENAHPLDTLMEFLPKREDQLLEGVPFTRYHLDDYVRFPSVREICVELLPQLSYLRSGGKWTMRLNMSDATDSRRFRQENVLVLMDGVVLTDHGILEDFDAMLLEDIDIYSLPVAIGELAYNGVVNFVTKKNYVTALQFPDNTRVVDFKGVSWPVAYPGAAPAGEDLRQLLFWHPSLRLPAGTDVRIPLRTPAYAGRFRIVVEGRNADGSPVRASASFEVE